MADNVQITAGSGTTIATDDVGGAQVQRIKLGLGADGTAVDAVAGAGAVSTAVQRVTLASDDPAVTSLAIMDDWDESDRIKANIIAGQVGVAGGAGAVAATVQRVTLASDDPAVALLSGYMTTKGWGFDVAVTPTVTNGAYGAGDIMGGLMTFSAVARANDELVMITGAQVVSKAAVLPSLTLILFNASPTGTTSTDNSPYSLAAADAFKVVGTVSFPTIFDHGTPNSWRVDDLSIVAAPVSGARTFFGVLVDGTGVTLTSTSDIQVRLRGIGV